MSYDSLLIHTCSVIQITETKGNVRTESITTGVNCRFMFKNRIVRDFTGEEAVSVGRVFFDKAQLMRPDTKIIFDGNRYAVLQINKPADSLQRHHLEVDIA